MLRNELQLSEHQCSQAEAFARSYVTESRLYMEERRALRDELQSLRQAGSVLEGDRDKYKAELEISQATVATLRAQLDEQVEGRRKAQESAREVMLRADKHEDKALQMLRERQIEWERTVISHVNKGLTHRVDPVIFANNAPLFDKVVALLQQEQRQHKERHELLTAFEAQQLDVTRSAATKELAALRAQIERARELHKCVSDATFKATTSFWNEEVGSLRKQLSSLEAQCEAATAGRDALRKDGMKSLQALRASLGLDGEGGGALISPPASSATSASSASWSLLEPH